MTPLYDILSAQPTFDAKQIPHSKYKLAMSAGNNNHYQILNIQGRHLVETGRRMGLGPKLINVAISQFQDAAINATEIALAEMPDDFDISIHESISQAIKQRLPRLDET